jgi:hypothetical protein
MENDLSLHKVRPLTLNFRPEPSTQNPKPGTGTPKPNDIFLHKV